MSPHPDFTRAEYIEPTPAESAFSAPERTDAPATPDTALLVRAILFGIAGAAAGAIIDALFIGITHINLGYLALFIAYLVAKTMTFGSKGQGGRAYQIASLILTYLSVSAAHSMLIWWQVHEEGQTIPFSLHNIFILAKLGIESPFLRFQDAGVSALIGLFILFIGLRAAWRMTSGEPGAVRHPFSR